MPHVSGAFILTALALAASVSGQETDESQPGPESAPDKIQPICIAVSLNEALNLEQRSARDLFMEQWYDRNFEYVKLTPRQAAWFYSLGSYSEGGKPGQYEPPTSNRPSESSSSSSSNSESKSQSSGRSKRQSSCYHIPQPLRLRQEYRQMSNAERSNFVSSINNLKSFIPDPTDPTTSGFDIFVLFHQGVNSPGAHGGAAFLPWHREYLFRFENALIEQGYLYGLPYYDSTLDQGLPVPSDSVIWTSAYLGSATGVVGAPFSGWTIVPTCSGLGATLTRSILTGPSGHSWLFSDTKINNVLSSTCYRDLVTSPFEGYHGSVHVYIGGHMGSSQCSPSDPVFWMHHGFVDCVWETFRQSHQTLSSPELEYPSQTGNGDTMGGIDHEWYTDMSPFEGLVNAHGMSNHYTNYYYECKARPKTCFTDTACGNTAALWCDTAACRCRSKVKQGGDCTGLPNKACAGPCPFFQYPYCDTTTVPDTCSCKSFIIAWTGAIVKMPLASPISGSG